MTLFDTRDFAYAAPDGSEARAALARLAPVVDRLLDDARAQGADAAEVGCSESDGLNVGVRLGEVETLERNRDRSVAITVYRDGRKGSASTADLSDASLTATVRQALAIAAYTEVDPESGLADREWLATTPQDFDLWHPWEISVEQAIDQAIACEAAGRKVSDDIRNSEGASVATGSGVSLYGNSHGFRGASAGTHHSIGCSFIAGEGELMQREGWYDFRIRGDELEDPESVGRHAAERALSRLNPQSIPTGQYPILFDREMSRGLIGHLLGALSGGAQYRKTSFLTDSIGESVLPEWVSLTEDPYRLRGLNSAWFDGDGVATQATDIITDGRVARYLLSTYSARKLGLQSTGNAGGSHNLQISTNARDREELLARMGTGVLVTQLMGQGVNAITGDYSRGASGFWVENGQIQYPVDGITIAGNLRDMYGRIVGIGADVDHRSQHRIGSILIENMTVAGS